MARKAQNSRRPESGGGRVILFLRTAKANDINQNYGSVLVGPLEKRVFSSLWPCQCFLLIFVARVSTVTELTGSVAKKKSTDKKATNWKNSLKNWTFGRIFLRKWRRLVIKWSCRWLASPILLQGGMTLEYTPHIKRCLCRLLYNAGQFLSN